MIKPKTSMTNIDVAAWVSETQEIIIGSRIINIYQLEENTYLMKIHSRVGEKINIVIEPSRRIHITRYVKEADYKTIPPIVAKLRKHLRGGIIKDVYQLGLDRIVIFEVIKANTLYKLIIELIPRGVLILTNGEENIVMASKYMELKDRAIRVGIKYKPPPPSTNMLQIDISEFKTLLYKGVDIVRGLVKYIGLPGEVAEDILARLNIRKTLNPKELSHDDCNKLYNYIKNFIIEIKEKKNIKPCHIIVDEKPITVLPFSPVKIPKEAKIKEFSNFNDALDEYFTAALKEQLAEKELKELQTKIKKLEKSIVEQEKQLHKHIEELEKRRKVLQKIYEKYADLENLWNRVLESFNQSRWNGLKKFREIVEVNKRKGIVGVKINDLKAELDIRKSFHENVIELQQKVKELERKIERIKEAIREVKKKKEKIKVEGVEVRKRIELKIRKKEWFEKYHWIITTNGFLAIGGRNAEQNESIVRRYLEDKDIFIHADIHGAPAVILKTMNKEPKDEDIKDAALIAAAYSRAWKEGLMSIDVFWVKGSQVSKTPPPGEYLAKGAFMIYGKKNYIRNVELKLAIGIRLSREEYKVIIGPEELISKQAICYAVIIPGDIEVPSLAKALLNMWIRKCRDEELKMLIKNVNINDIIQRIPGKSKILKVECYC